MVKKRLIAVTTAAVLVLGVIGLWQWAPWSERAALPSCDEVAAMLPDTVPGSWTVTHAQPDPNHLLGCELDLTSADQAHAGEVRIIIIDSHDAAMLQKLVADSPCYGGEINVRGAERYRAARSCSNRIDDKVLASIYAASERRFTHVLVSLTGFDQSGEQTFSYTNDTVQRIASFTMTLTTTDEGSR